MILTLLNSAAKKSISPKNILAAEIISVHHYFSLRELTCIGEEVLNLKNKFLDWFLDNMLHNSLKLKFIRGANVSY